MMHITNIWG